MIQVIIEYPKNNTNLTVSLSGKTNFEILNIQECPAISDAIILTYQQWFRNRIDNLQNTVAIIFNINEIIDSDEADAVKFCKFSELKPILLSFESTIEKSGRIIYWKIQNAEKLTKINFEREVPDEVFIFIRDFLISSLIAGYSGLLPEQSTNLKPTLSSLGTIKGLNLLMLAVQKENINVLSYLLSLPFDVNFENDENQSAADISLEMRNFEILSMLLNANSKFPTKLDVKEVPEEIKNFIQVCEDMHNAIKCQDMDNITRLIKENSNLRHFYNLENISAAATAISVKSLEIYFTLFENNIFIAPHESLYNIVELTDSNHKEKVRLYLNQFNVNHSRELVENHLMVLMSNSFIACDDSNTNDRFALVKEAYEVLNAIPMVKICLKIIAAFKHFRFVYDFNRENLHFLDPTTRISRGASSDNNILIGAKNFSCPLKKFSAFAVLAHECVHFCMKLVFHNDGDPYPKGDKTMEAKFAEIIDQCRRLRDHDEIIRSVYGNYPAKYWAAELIVRVVHIEVHYCMNVEKIQELRDVFRTLFDFYETIILAKFVNSLAVIEKLSHENSTIVWNDLTDDLKLAIKHSDVEFQGQKIPLYKIIIENNSEIYQNLNSEQIKEILNYKIIRIYDAPNYDLDFYVKRKFVGENDENVDKKLFSQKIVLLFDAPGAGKTTTFKNMAIYLKKQFPHKFIAFIDLKQHLRVFKEINNVIELKIENLKSFLLKILNLNSNPIESEIFENLFMNNRAIFFWDGLDEISPNYKKEMLEIMKLINKSTDNQQWMSSRPQHAEEVEETFETKGFKLEPFDDDEKNEFIIQNLKTKEIPNGNVEKIKKFVNEFFQEADNPLMLQIICEVSIDKDILHETFNEYFNIFSVYKRFLIKKIEIMNEKGSIARNSRDSMLLSEKMSILEIHQIYALKSLITSLNDDLSEYEKDKITSLRILKMKIPFDYQEISRFGILSLKSNGDFDFVHRTFAEYFVADFLIKNIYDIDDDTNELENILTLLFIVSKNEKCKIIQRFLLDYVKKPRNEISLRQNDSIVSLIKKMCSHCKIDLTKESITFLGKLFSFSGEIIQNFESLMKSEI